jgi:hypothetical protein
MNPTQAGDLAKQVLVGLGVSSATVGLLGDQFWIAVGGVLIAGFSLVWQFIVRKTPALVANVVSDPEAKPVLLDEIAKEPDVAAVVVHSAALADSIQNPKVVHTSAFPMPPALAYR